MSVNEKFDWLKYYELAVSYRKENDSAKLRTGINRFYYSIFLKSRDYLIENNMFLNDINRHIMKSKSGRVHRETRLTLQNHPTLNIDKNGEKIAKRLNILRKYRNMVDYDSKNPKDLKHDYNRCYTKARKILELLNELNT